MEQSDLAELVVIRRWVADGTAARIREQAGLTRQEIGDVVGVTGGTIWNWETQRRLPRGPEAVAYARVIRGLREEVGNDAATG